LMRIALVESAFGVRHLAIFSWQCLLCMRVDEMIRPLFQTLNGCFITGAASLRSRLLQTRQIK
jgi:hypothetical protein